MKKLMGQISLSFLLLIVSNPVFAIERNIASPGVREVIRVESEALNETCVDEYALRNKYLKKFIIWAPPTVVVSLPVASYAYFLGIYGLLTIAPYEIIFYAGFGLWYIGVPVIAGTAITLEVRNTVEYFRNRSIVRVIDALRLNDVKSKHVKKFLKNFRKKYPESELTNDQVFSEILSLDRAGSLCNGDLTESNSDKIRELLAKNKHLYRHLSQL